MASYSLESWGNFLFLSLKLNFLDFVASKENKHFRNPDFSRNAGNYLYLVLLDVGEYCQREAELEAWT